MDGQFFYASEASGSVLNRVIGDFVPDATAATAATAARLTLQANQDIRYTNSFLLFKELDVYLSHVAVC